MYAVRNTHQTVCLSTLAKLRVHIDKTLNGLRQPPPLKMLRGTGKICQLVKSAKNVVKNTLKEPANKKIKGNPVISYFFIQFSYQRQGVGRIKERG